MNNHSATLLRGAIVLIGLSACTLLGAQVNRTYDGSGNNQLNSDWGTVSHPLIRWSPAQYPDNASAPTGADRPNPRTVSNELFSQELSLIDAMGLSDFCWVFGQFIDHDITLTPDGPEAFVVPVPRGDPSFDPFNTGSVVIPMRRSAVVEGTGTESGNPRQHPNEITAFLDASNVYGPSKAHADWLRTFEDGKMKISSGNLLPYNTEDGEFESEIDPSAPHMDNPTRISDKIFVAGDVRVNENPLLATLHTLFVREHNRLCDVLLNWNPSLDDETLYQRARKLNGAILQSITYQEWLPAMGLEVPAYTGYKANVDATISNSFSGAAFRMGHTLLNGQIRRLNLDGTIHPDGPLALRDAFFNPAQLPNSGGVDPFLKGMAEQTQQPFDARVVDDVRNFLFGPPGAGGLDLAAININRGRDRGLPDFNSIRSALGLEIAQDWSDVSSDEEIQDVLSGLYPDINDVDPWVGMLAEDAMEDRLFGQTVSAALERQFAAMRDGDRFFYLNDPAISQDERDVITNTRFSDLIRRNSNVRTVQGNVFTSMPHAEVPVCSASDISGDIVVEVQLPDGTPLPDVTTRLYGLNDGMPRETTAQDGFARYSTIPTCDDYGVEAEADPAEMLRGVNVVDIVAIARHILGQDEILDPYALVAADVNRSGSVTAFDITNVRRVLLNKASDFFGQPSWTYADSRFLPGDIDDPLTFDFQSRATIELFDGNANVSLTAIKAGDVDQSLRFGSDLQPRSTVLLTAEKLANRTNAIQLTPSRADLSGLQAVFQLPAGDRFVRVEGLDEAEYAISETGNELRIVIARAESNLPSFVVEMSADANQMSLSTRDASIDPLAVDATGNTQKVQFVAAQASVSVQLTTVAPNPIVESASITFPATYASGGVHDFVVIDELGREILRKRIQETQLTLQRNELPALVNASYRWFVENDGETLESGMFLTAN